MKKRGLSQVVAIVLILIISLVAIGVLWGFVKNLLEKETTSIEKAQTALNCIQGVDITILDACYKNNLFKITIKNQRELILGDFFLVDFFRNS